METFKANKLKAHFAIGDNGHWYEMECKHCGWTIAVPKRETTEVLADRLTQINDHLKQSHLS